MISALHSIGMTNPMITSSFLTIVIIIVALCVSRNLETYMPGPVQNMIEMGLEKLQGFFSEL
ncbi:MAG: hypothetical protein Q4B78_03320, partial [Bacillota bacterium]|nr:hypothetical protein [Bacillota bacterium]